MKLTALILALCGSAVLATTLGMASASAGTTHHPRRLSESITRDGLVLTVAFAHRAAPRGSIQLVSFTIGNTANRPVKFLPWCIFGYSGPAVSSPQGTGRYPPAFPPLYRVGGCTFPYRYELSAIPAGYQATVRRYVVFRGSELGFSMVRPAYTGHRITGLRRIPSGMLHIRLTARTNHPHVGFSTLNGLVVAKVSGAAAADRLHVSTQAVCAGGPVRKQLRWFVSGPTVKAPCAHVLKWRVAAGIVGHSIGVGTYSSHS